MIAADPGVTAETGEAAGETGAGPGLEIVAPETDQTPGTEDPPGETGAETVTEEDQDPRVAADPAEQRISDLL